MKNTLIINLYGGPGTGKSTGAAYIFSKLKMAGIDAELITEFAKDKVWERNTEVFKCQFYIIGKQVFRISRCFGKVDVMVTDSPIRLGKIYADIINRPILGKAALEEAEIYDKNSIDVFLKRCKPYNPNGRNQTEEEAIQIDKQIKSILPDSHLEFDATTEGYDKIFEYVMTELKKRKV